jgi:hypothetical protein
MATRVPTLRVASRIAQVADRVVGLPRDARVGAAAYVEEHGAPALVRRVAFEHAVLAQLERQHAVAVQTAAVLGLLFVVCLLLLLAHSQRNTHTDRENRQTDKETGDTRDSKAGGRLTPSVHLAPHPSASTQTHAVQPGTLRHPARHPCTHTHASQRKHLTQSLTHAIIMHSRSLTHHSLTHSTHSLTHSPSCCRT